MLAPSTPSVRRMAGRSPSYRPSRQPSSPRIEINGACMTSTLQQQRLRPSRQHPAARGPGSPSNSLSLPGIPRFHPANFPSAQSSMANTPALALNSPQAPMSPRSQQRAYSEAQRALLSYQRDFYSQQMTLANAGIHHRRHGSGSSQKSPRSPRLVAVAGSPGPVTPLELEADGYITARINAGSAAERQSYVDHMLRQETKRLNRGSHSPGEARSKPTTPVGSC